MKPLKTHSQDPAALADLGRASAQIVHDLKNQINGLKLYATFLRKRMEKPERPADELETINKLIAGLERAANETSLLVRYSREIELRAQTGADLTEILRAANGSEAFIIESSAESLKGNFDTAMLAEAFKDIATGAQARIEAKGGALETRVRLAGTGDAPEAVVEWRGARLMDDEEDDPFRSFAGGQGLRLALAAKIVRAHGGEATHEDGVWRVRLPLNRD